MKILLITTSFYPQNKVSVLRVGQWAKYWALDGHEVTILTTKKYPFSGPFGLEVVLPSNVKVVEVDFIPNWLFKKHDKTTINENDAKVALNIEYLKRQLRVLRKYIGSLFDIHDLWINPATRVGLDILTDDSFDLIVSSYAPPAAHVVASRLKTKYPNIRWIADFRDLWANNHISSAKGVFKYLELYKEILTIKDKADILMTVSSPLVEELKKRYQNAVVWKIENGFDPDEFPYWEENIKHKPGFNDSITIVYAGTIYPGKRDPSVLFDACNQLIDEGLISCAQIKICFYGNNKQELDFIINKYNSNRHGIVNICGFVSRIESLKAQKASDLLLFIESNEPSAKGVLTGKLFEYLVSGVPILAVGIDRGNAAGNLIEMAGVGVCCLSSNQVKKVLLQIFDKKIVDFYNPNINFIKEYSRDKQSKKIIQKLVDN